MLMYLASCHCRCGSTLSDMSEELRITLPGLTAARDRVARRLRRSPRLRQTVSAIRDNIINIGLEIEENVLLIFGNPKVGSKLMAENSDLGFYLPLRAQVYRKNNKVYLNITNLEFLKTHYQLKKPDNLKLSEKIEEMINGIEKAAKTLGK